MLSAEGGTLIHLVSSNRWRGSAQHALDICSRLLADGWDVSVFTRDCKTVDRRFAAAGIPIRHAPLGGFADPASPYSLARCLKASPEATVIHTHRYQDAFTALLARKLCGRKDVRVILTRHTASPGRDNWLYRRIYRNLDAQIFISETVRSRFLSTWLGERADARLPFPESRLHVLYESTPHAGGVTEPEPRFGPRIAMYAGAIKPGKGLETLIDAMMLLKGKRTRLRIAGAGDPDYVDTLRRRILTRGVQDIVDWKKDPDNLDALISQSHIGVLPATNPEAFGLNNLRFMAAGRPLVCTDNGAQAEYLTDGVDALLVRPCDAEALGEALVRLATDDPLRHAMGRRAADTYRRRLSWPAFISALLDIYRS